MAFKGHNRQAYCIIKETTAADGIVTETLGDGVITNHTVDFKSDGTANKTDIYAGDEKEFSETGAKGGKVDIEISQLPLKDEAAMLGHKFTQEDGLIDSGNDEAPMMRYAAIGVGVRKETDGTKKTFYRFVGCYKVQFEEVTDEFHTKEENPKFITHKVGGTLFLNSEGKKKVKKDFDDFAAALAFMKTFANVKEVV